MWDGGVVVVKEGQLITGRKTLSEETGLPETTIERILTYLESEHQIGQQKTTKFRLITIVNWKDYQNPDIKTDNKRTTNGQQTDTNKNDNNVKNDKKTPASGEDEASKFIYLFKGINPAIGRLYGRPPQRAAAERLLKEHPLDWWERFIQAYSSKLSDRFCPKAFTPIQMEEKLGAIYQYAEGLKGNIKNKQKIWI